MKRLVVIVTALTWLGIGNIVSAKDLMPWETENINISTSGIHSVKIDDRVLFFEVPADQATKAGRASEVITRGDRYEDWLKKNGEYQKGCFGLSWNFYPMGVPLFGGYAQFSILAKLHVKTGPALRNIPGLPEFDSRLGYLPPNSDRGDFSKPEELRANMERLKGDKNHATPVEEVLINNRKWYHYLENSAGYPDALRENYITGLAPDRYLKITIDFYPAPFSESRYPTYPTEAQRPRWMKKAFKYKEQVINSIRIAKPEGSKEPDLYEVETLTPLTESPQPPPDKPIPTSTLPREKGTGKGDATL